MLRNTAMSLPKIFAIGSAIACIGTALAQSESKKAPLFDGKTMTGWYTFFKDDGKNKDDSGEISIVDGSLRIAGKKTGYLSTEKEYSNYKLSFTYRWADTTEKEQKRNSGLIYHAIGEDRLWCNGMEMQMQQGDAGDLWLIPGAGTSAAITVKETDLGGTSKGTRVEKWEANEKPLGEWNEAVLVCRGKEFEHWVNGKKVLSGVTKDREKGKIQFQAEGFEVWIRSIEIEELN